MSRIILSPAVCFIILFNLILYPALSNAKPARKPIDPKAAMDKLFQDQATQVNRLNKDVKAVYDLSSEDEKELRSKKTPLTMTPDEIKKDDADIANDPDDQEEEDIDEIRPNQAGQASGVAPGAPVTEQIKSKYPNAPASAPSSSGGVAVPGQADPNMIVFPGRKKK